MTVTQLAIPDAHAPSMPIPHTTSTSQLLAVLSRVMADPSVDMNRIERAEAMYERAVKRDAEIAFSNAFADAKAKIPVILKNRHVKYESTKSPTGFVEYNHEDLGGIAEVIDPILAENGLTYRWEMEDLEGGRFKVTCILSHRSGHRETAYSTGARDTSGAKNDYQARQSAETYLKRSTLKAVVGIAVGERDDDGRAGGASAHAGSITEDQLRQLIELADDVGADKRAFCEYLGIEALAALPATQFQRAIAALNKKRAAR